VSLAVRDNMAPRLAVMVATLWWGMLTGLAFVAVPSLFAKLGNPAVAGPVAAWLFAVVAKLSMGCGAGLALYLKFLLPHRLIGGQS
jgi:hypothetical protein